MSHSRGQKKIRPAQNIKTNKSLSHYGGGGGAIDNVQPNAAPPADQSAGSVPLHIKCNKIPPFPFTSSRRMTELTEMVFNYATIWKGTGRAKLHVYGRILDVKVKDAFWSPET
jgi:hypothetical protein